MSASLLKERVRIEQPTTASDSYGGVTVTWSTLATVFAEVTPLLGNTERLAAGQVMASAGYRVRIRHRSDVTAAMRLVWKGHTLLIHSLHEQETFLNLLTYEESL